MVDFLMDTQVALVLFLSPGVSAQYKAIIDIADILVIKHTSRCPRALRFPDRVKNLLYLESTVFNSLSTPT
jgi:hypothetical protein